MTYAITDIDSSFHGFIASQRNDKTPSWLVSSVGRALHRCRRGHGFKSGRGLKIFPLKEEDLIGVMTFYG